MSDEAPRPDDDGEPAADPTPTTPSPWRRLAWVGIAAAALAVPLAARVVWEGRAELELADRARDEGDGDLEVEHLGRAARWRMPLFGHDEDAIERLIDIGTAAEAEGESGTQRALLAYREARRAILATRTWGVPDQETFELVNERIARLMADQEVRFGTDVGGEGDPYAHHLALLQQVPGPQPWRANLAALAFVSWIVATAGFVMRSIDLRGHLIPKPAVRWGLGSLALLLVWVLAVRFAS